MLDTGRVDHAGESLYPAGGDHGLQPGDYQLSIIPPTGALAASVAAPTVTVVAGRTAVLSTP